MRPLPRKVLVHWNPDLYSVEGGCILDSGVSEVWVRLLRSRVQEKRLIGASANPVYPRHRPWCWQGAVPRLRAHGFILLSSRPTPAGVLSTGEAYSILGH